MLHCLHDRNRKREAEGGSVSETALDSDLPAQRFDETAHQGEAQAGAAFGEGIEAVEDVSSDRSASMPRPVSRTVNCTKSLISSAASRISPSCGV